MSRAGLCERCSLARKVVSAKGSVFWLCGAHDLDKRWPKYPPLPVMQCPHHRPGDPVTR